MLSKIVGISDPSSLLSKFKTEEDGMLETVGLTETLGSQVVGATWHCRFWMLNTSQAMAQPEREVLVVKVAPSMDRFPNQSHV